MCSSLTDSGATDRGVDCQRTVEHHALGPLTTEAITHALMTCGLEVTYNEAGLTGRGLFIGQHVRSRVNPSR